MTGVTLHTEQVSQQ